MEGKEFLLFFLGALGFLFLGKSEKTFSGELSKEIISNQKEMRVAVIGLGTAGAAVSVLLKRTGGHSVEIFEKFASARPVGSGILLQMTGMSVLNHLGALDHVLDHGAIVERLYGTTDKSWWSSSQANNNQFTTSNDNNSKVVLDLVYKEYNESFFGLGVHRSTLFDSLYSKVRQEQIPVHFDTSITETSLLLNNDSTDGSYVRDLYCEKHHKTYGPFDLVINCTGTHSHLLNSGSQCIQKDRATSTSNIDNQLRKVKPYEFGSLWTTCPDINGEFTSQKQIIQKYRDASYMAGVMPCGRLSHTDQPLVSVFWSLKRDHAKEFLNPDSSLDEWKERFTTYWKVLTPLMDHVKSKDQLLFAHYNDIRMKQHYYDNLVYIGDVCHGTSPQLGQGANLALVDAFTLAQLLSNPQSNDKVDVSSGLKQFHKMRRSHVQYYQYASAWLTPFFQSESKLAAFMRDHILGVSCKVPPLQWWMSRTLSGIQTFGGTLDLNVSQVADKRKQMNK